MAWLTHIQSHHPHQTVRWKSSARSSFIDIYVMMAGTQGAAGLRGTGWEASRFLLIWHLYLYEECVVLQERLIGRVYTKQWKAIRLPQCRDERQMATPETLTEGKQWRLTHRACQDTGQLTSNVCVGDLEGLSSLHPTKEEPDLHEWDKSSCLHSFAPSFPCSLVAEHTLNAGRQVDTGDEVRGTRFLGEPELVG